MNKTNLLASIILAGISLAPVQAATVYTGSLQTSDGTLVAQDLWSDAVFSWAVSDGIADDGSVIWTYQYTWTGSNKDLSHIDVETDPGFSFEDIISSSTNRLTETLVGPTWLNEKTGDSLFGVKWNLAEDSLDFQATLVTAYAPIWGDMFAKDGTDPNTGDLVYAYNGQFGSDSALPAGSGNNGGWTLIPGGDISTPPTSAVPVPAAAWLFGSGLIGMVGVARRRGAR